MKIGFSQNMRIHLLVLLVALMFVGFAPSAHAAIGDLDAGYAPVTRFGYIARFQGLGSIDATFPTGTGFNGSVVVTLPQPDGKMVVAGQFTSYDGTTRNHIARLNADGSLDDTFDPGAGVDGSVNAMVLDGTDIYIGGFFSHYNNTALENIARINEDGSLDAGFNPGTGFNNTVFSLALDGTDIYAGGGFTSYNGTARNRIARLNTNGTLDNGFAPSGSGLNSTVNSVILDGTDVYVGGNFTSFNGTDRNYIARLDTDGTLDTDFDPGTGFDSFVGDLLLTGSDVYVSGAFNSFNGTDRKYIARVHSDGSIDDSFETTGTGLQDIPTAMALVNGADLFVVGAFTSYDGFIRHGFLRLFSSGALRGGFVPTGSGLDGTVSTVSIDVDGNVVVGGDFLGHFGQGFSEIGTSEKVTVVLRQPDGKMLVGGDFTTYNNTFATRIARLNADGTLDGDFNPGIGFNFKVRALALAGTDIYVGGDFTTFNGGTENHIVRLHSDGTLDAAFDASDGFDGSVTALAFDGTDVYAGGSFSSYGVSSRPGIARLNDDGTIDDGFNPGTGFDDNVESLMFDGTSLLVGGNFTSYNGTARNKLVRLNTDGTLTPGFDIGTGFNGGVSSIALDGTDIYTGGFFTSFNGTSRNRIARLNTDGSLDSDFAPSSGANGNIYSVITDGNGVYVGGTFTSFNGTTRNRIASVNADGSLDTGFNPGTASNNSVLALAFDVTDLVVGGDFTRFNDTPRHSIARVAFAVPGFSPLTGSVNVSENGTSQAIGVVLNARPLGDVVISATSSDPTEATVAPASLTFTSENWSIPQYFVVTGVDDVMTDGNQTSNITLAIVDGSSSDEFDAAADQTVSVTTADNEPIVGGGGGGGGGGGLVNTIHLISPNGGEALHAGQQLQVSWQYTGSANHTAILALSTDGGSTYAQIAAPAQQDSGLYTWTVPDINTSSAKLRVDFVQNGSVVVSDVSDASFSIAGTVVTPPADGTNPPPAVPTVFTPSATINEDLGIVAATTPTPCVSGSLIRTSSSSAVYYCGANGKRYVFPNEKVYFSWYADFSSVTVISNETMATIQLGGNVTYKPGTRMIKIESDPKVYVVSKGGLLRWVPTEAIATRLYGTTWNKMIDDVSVSFFPNYRMGTEIQAAEIP